MKKIKQKFELLAPAGSFPNLIAAVNAGADAVYFGLQNFSMRASAKNFTINDLDKMREICWFSNEILDKVVMEGEKYG